MSKKRIPQWIACLNVPTAVVPGHIIKEKRSPYVPVALVPVMANAQLAAKRSREEIAHLIAAAPQMKADIEAFIAAVKDCSSCCNAVEITRDFYDLFSDCLAKAEGRKK